VTVTAIMGAVSAGGSAIERGPWATELIDLARAASGGLLFGVPLLYTTEVWWTGSHTDGGQVLAVLGVTFIPVFLLNRTGGFRSHRSIRLRDAVGDTVEALALGIVLVAGVLVLLRELTGDTPLRIALGKVAYETMPFCIGIGVARHFLARSTTDDDAVGSGGTRGDEPDEAMNATLKDLGAAAIGAVFVGLAIAPTDEVPTLAAAMTPGWLLAMMAVSLVVSYAIVFVAGFTNQQNRERQTGLLQRPSSETVASYLISLAVSGLMLWFFQRADGSPSVTLSNILVLGLPAVVGGAAGRLAV
jgi:putative integral membrane protein (TIGR02587 family)